MLGLLKYASRRSNAYAWRRRYWDVLKSERWQQLRAEVIAEMGGRCEGCGYPGHNRLHLHHRHYRNLGREKRRDVQLLCKYCHQKADTSRVRRNRDAHMLRRVFRFFFIFALVLGNSLAAVAIMTTPAVAETQMWVTADAANRRTCPSTECGALGWLLYRQSVQVIEVRDGWGRISKYYDASCIGGRSKFVDSGRAACIPENGIVDGKFAEWVRLNLLSETRPPDPSIGATGTAQLVAQSDDFRLYQAEFVKAAEALMASGQCVGRDFTEVGGFMKSTTKGAGIYFIYCGGMRRTDRIYLDVATGRTFR